MSSRRQPPTYPLVARRLDAAQLARTRRVAMLMLGLCAGAALALAPARVRAEGGHESPPAHKPAAAGEPTPGPSIKPSLKHAAENVSKREASAATPPTRTAAPASGHLEDVRQRLQEKVNDIRNQQEARTLTLAARAPAHRAAGTGAPKGHASAAAAGAHGGAHGGAAHWSYGGEGGPETWGELKPEFSTCRLGQRQSPIDIREGIRVELDPVKFDYRPSAFNVLDNGHTVQVNVAPGNTITVGTRRFELLQFHFHRPSEERINGRQFEMVAHLVHRDLDGRLAVVAVLMDQGRQHPLVQQVWNNLPLEKNVNEPGSSAIDLTQLLPEDRRYFTYMGSLTTPPCTEGVQWIVLKQPAMVSYEQVSVFSRLYPMNARPIQRAGDRLIKESN